MVWVSFVIIVVVLITVLVKLDASPEEFDPPYTY